MCVRVRVCGGRKHKAYFFPPIPWLTNMENSITQNLLLHNKKSGGGFHSGWRFLKGWQMERISPVLDLENAEEKAVHYKHDASPGEDSDLLSLWVGYPRDF